MLQLLKACLVFSLSELQCRKVLLFSEKSNKRSDFKIRLLLPQNQKYLRRAEAGWDLWDSWAQSGLKVRQISRIWFMGLLLPSCKTLRAPNPPAKHPNKFSPGWHTRSSFLQRRTGMAWVCFPTWWEITPRLFPGIYPQAEGKTCSDSKE